MAVRGRQCDHRLLFAKQRLHQGNRIWWWADPRHDGDRFTGSGYQRAWGDHREFRCQKCGRNADQQCEWHNRTQYLLTSSRPGRQPMSNILTTIGVRGLTIALLMMAVCGSAFSQQSTGGQFTVSRHTIDNDGGTSQGGQFSLTGTIAQPDAGAQAATGGQFSLRGGFWSAKDLPTSDVLFSDGFESP